MPKGSLPDYRKRKEPILDDHLRASMEHAGGVHDPVTGHYAELHYVGCDSRDRAKEIIRALHRSARYVGVSVSAKPVKAADGTWTVVYKAIDKNRARQYVLDTYGPDPSKWPYSPRAKNPPKESN